MTEDEKPIRVVDRRMFTPDGELRPGFQPEEEPVPPAPPAAAPAQAGERKPPPAADTNKANPPEFLALVEFFASNISTALGYDPHTGQRTGRINGAAARQMIDLLAVLESKTRGNLSFEESTFLSQVLTELRLVFVEVTRSPAQ